MTVRRFPPLVNNYPTRCQRAAWKEHKPSCRSQQQEEVLSEEAKPAISPVTSRPQAVNAPRDPPTLSEVLDMVNVAKDSLNWKGVLRCEGRMEDLLSKMREPSQAELLNVFITAFYNEAHFAKAP